MIVKSYVLSDETIDFYETCVICEHPIPEGAVVLRHTETDNALCVPCLGLIALLNVDDPVTE